MRVIKYYSVSNDSYQANLKKQDSRYTAFQSRGPVGLMLHSVGCSQPRAEVFARQWDRAGYAVSVHAVLQADGTVYQCMPWNFRAWHCGGSANNTHVGVEMTEPAEITYTGGSRFTVSEKDRAAAVRQVRGTYNTAVELFAMLCKEYGINPMTGIISHKEGHSKGLASDHGDPEHLWRGLGLGYTMDTFRAAVKAKMEAGQIRTGWHEDSTGWWYVLEDGSYPKSAWRQIDGVWYYFGPDGYMLRDTELEYDGKTYVFDHQGHAAEKEEDEMLSYEMFCQYMDRYQKELAQQAPSDWSAEDRAWAEETGLIRGDEQGRTMYKSPVTREQLAAILHRYDQGKQA